MKKAILFIASAFITIQANSQTQLGNGDMELWQNVGSSTEEPTNWNSFKTASGGLAAFAAQQIWRSTNIRAGATGSYCAQIKCVSILGVAANGVFTLGQVNMGSSTATSSSNYNWSKTSDVNFSEALTDTPDSIVFWVKYTPVNASHQARVSVVLHDNYDYRDGYNIDAPSAPHKVAEAQLNYGTTSGTWVRKAVPFVYTGPASANTFIIATFATNMTPGVGTVNDEVLIDDIQLIYNPVNQPVVANDDAITTLQDQAVIVPVVANDVDPENDFDLGSVAVTVAPTNGSTSVNTLTGEITYTPNAGYFGTDVFTYTICDNGLPVLCDNAIVTVTVTQVVAGNNQIIANDDNVVVDMNQVLVTNVVANDVDFENQIDLTTLAVTVQPTNGTATANIATGEITYTPNLNYFGSDSYSYTICDAGVPSPVTCDGAVVNVTVNLVFGLTESANQTITIAVKDNQIELFNAEQLEGNYSIYTMSGTLVQTGEIEKLIPFNGNSGIYLIHLNSTTGLIVKKISKI